MSGSAHACPRAQKSLPLKTPPKKDHQTWTDVQVLWVQAQAWSMTPKTESEQHTEAGSLPPTAGAAQGLSPVGDGLLHKAIYLYIGSRPTLFPE